MVLVLGCGTGADVAPLEKRFRGARILGTDRSTSMLLAALRGRRRWRARSEFLRCDPRALPLADGSVDLVYANLSLAALDDPAPAFAEIARVLRADGLFVFATLGPDSLDELRNAWAAVDDGPHVQSFLDMHDLGDLLLRAGMRDPVLDVDRLRLEYAGSAALFRDLTATGARNALAGRRRSLTGRARFGRMTAALETAAQGMPIELGLELVYGHCWSGGGSARMPMSASILRRFRCAGRVTELPPATPAHSRAGSQVSVISTFFDCQARLQGLHGRAAFSKLRGLFLPESTCFRTSRPATR